MNNDYAEFREIIRDIIREEIEKYFKQNSVEKKYGGIVTALYPFVEVKDSLSISGIEALPSPSIGDIYEVTNSGDLKKTPSTSAPTIAVQSGDKVIWTSNGWELYEEIPVDPYEQRCAIDLGFTTIGSSSPNEMILNKSGEVLNIGDSVSIYANSSGSFVNAYVGIKHTPLN